MSGKRSRAFRAYQKIKTLKPARSLIDLSHEIMMTCEMFKLYPVCFLEMSPGDTFHIANQSVTRLQPLNAPILSPITQSTHYFFVPYRLLWNDWIKFITGGEDGESGGNNRTGYVIDPDTGEKVIAEPSEIAPELPRWIPSNGKNGVGSLWDYFGLPTGVKPAGAYPLDFLRRAYNLIWNEYYRDENLQEEVGLDNEDILYRSWKKDYFTSALLSQQRGISPAMPVNGSVEITTSNLTVTGTIQEATLLYMRVSVTLPTGMKISDFTFPAQRVTFTSDWTDIDTGVHTEQSESKLSNISVQDDYNAETGVANLWITFVNPLTGPSNHNYAGASNLGSISYLLSDYSEAKISDGGFDVKDLRQAFQIQKWLELANRGGVRYTEFLRAFFGVSPRDDRLQRPEYIGGSKSPIVVSEVLQTSSTNGEPTPQGYMAGHGLGAERTYIGSYSAQEYGIVIGLMSYTTPPLYSQGINRQWLRRSKYDFLFPQFTHLSEQAIEGAEIYATDTESENRKVFGFNEIYDELRAIPSLIVGKMRTTFNYWHLGRFFNSKPALNADFISGKDVPKRIFAVQNEEGIICNYANIIRALRPIPKYGTPGGV